MKIEMTWPELRERLCKAEKDGRTEEGYIVFTEDSFKKKYPEESRTYVTRNSSASRMFQEGKISNSMYGDCLDGTDNGVRLDWYIGEWHIEKCYVIEN